jgi:hypothetical protein
MNLDEKVEALFRRYRREAVLLDRIWPPFAGPVGRSKFGGLPNLPEHYDWPRAPERGVPLHFLAQIDCAEIPFPSPLPDRGMLFFFARDDYEQLWGFDGDPAEDCRVIHALDAFGNTPPREPPPDLPPIGDEWGRSTYWDVAMGDPPRPRGPGPKLHVEWPLRLYRMESWPDPSGLPEQLEEADAAWRRFLSAFRFGRSDAAELQNQDVYDRYLDLVDAKRAQAIAAATGRPLPRGLRDDRDAAARIFRHRAGGDGEFPERWITVEWFARHVLARYKPERADEAEARAAAATDEAALGWLRRARAASAEGLVPAEARRELRSWLLSLDPPRPPGVDPDLPGFYASRWIVGAVEWTIRTWAADRERAALVPEEHHAAVELFLAPNIVQPSSDRQGRPEDAFQLQWAQMLGHAPSAQEARPADDPTICLLNLESDGGVPWMFADVGQATFWIAPADLARRDFSRVALGIEGH